MSKTDIINTILSEWSTRSPDGLSRELSGEENLSTLYEVLLKNNVDNFVATQIIEEIVLILEKGKHPERQAYNKNGLLVTFPTPEYKQRAIAKGTHFETNPKAQQSNLFGGGAQAPSQPTPGGGPAPSVPMDAGHSELPRSDSQQPQNPPAQKEVPEPDASVTPVPAPSAATAPAVQTPAQGQLAVEPTPQTATTPVVASPAPPPTPPAPKKTPAQVEAEKLIIKQMMGTQDALPTIAGVGGTALTEQLQKLTKVALEMNLTEAVRFLSMHI